MTPLLVVACSLCHKKSCFLHRVEVVGIHFCQNKFGNLVDLENIGETHLKGFVHLKLINFKPSRKFTTNLIFIRNAVVAQEEEASYYSASQTYPTTKFSAHKFRSQEPKHHIAYHW